MEYREVDDDEYDSEEDYDCDSSYDNDNDDIWETVEWAEQHYQPGTAFKLIRSNTTMIARLLCAEGENRFKVEDLDPKYGSFTKDIYICEKDELFPLDFDGQMQVRDILREQGVELDDWIRTKEESVAIVSSMFDAATLESNKAKEDAKKMLTQLKSQAIKPSGPKRTRNTAFDDTV